MSAAPQMLQPGIILLRDGTDTSQGIPQLIGNINACEAIVEVVRTTLGPFGMDKMIIAENGTPTVSNDGATVLRLLDVVHPAARTLVEIARSQDSEVGDGTTSVVILAGELLTEAKGFVEEGVHPRLVIAGFREAASVVRDLIDREAAITLKEQDRSAALLRCAVTSLSSKLVSNQAAAFGAMVVRAVELVTPEGDPQLIAIRKESGGALEDTQLVEGVAFLKTFSYAGFEQAPKRLVSPRIALLNVELEIKKERDNAEIRVTNPRDYRDFVEAEWRIIYDKLDEIVASGANVVLSRLAIGDLATQYLASRGVFCAGRVPDDVLQCLARATGAAIQSSTTAIAPEALGSCGLFEERQVGANRYNFFLECRATKSVTILLRGAGLQFIDEAERSLHDAIAVVRRTAQHNTIVPGGGAVELHLSRRLHEHARSIPGKQQLIIGAFARALEAIPRQLVDNAGLDSSVVLARLRKAHAEGQSTAGVCLVGGNHECIQDSFAAHVWEPALVKRNSIESAAEAACMILNVDETIKNKRANEGAQG